jgi:hypothetical protein
MKLHTVCHKQPQDIKELSSQEQQAAHIWPPSREVTGKMTQTYLVYKF